MGKIQKPSNSEIFSCSVLPGHTLQTRSLWNYKPPTPYSQVCGRSQIDRTVVQQCKHLYVQVPGQAKASALRGVKPSPCSHWENGPAAARIFFSFKLFCSYHLNLESDIQRQNDLPCVSCGPTTETAPWRENIQISTKDFHTNAIIGSKVDLW
jgi:hypothetical protein